MDPVARDRRRALALAVPALAVFAAFWLLPMARLVQVGASGPEGIAAYFAVVTNASIANGHQVEYVPRSAGILAAMPKVEHGELVAPSGPGLGLELDDAAVRRYQVA